MRTNRIRPVVELSSKSLDLFRREAALSNKSLSCYLAELLLAGYQKSVPDKL